MGERQARLGDLAGGGVGVSRQLHDAHRQGVSIDEPTDDEVLAQSRLRPDAFGVIYARHAPAVHAYVARRAGTAVADDLLGEVFVTAVEARLRFRPHESGSALPWLYGIAANLLRSHRRRRAGPVTTDGDSGVDWDAVDARLDAAARRAELRSAMASLTDVERQLLLLVAWEGLTPSEAGAALGITPEAARTRLHRARRHAQAALDALTPAND